MWSDCSQRPKEREQTRHLHKEALLKSRNDVAIMKRKEPRFTFPELCMSWPLLTTREVSLKTSIGTCLIPDINPTQKGKKRQKFLKNIYIKTTIIIIINKDSHLDVDVWIPDLS